VANFIHVALELECKAAAIADGRMRTRAPPQ